MTITANDMRQAGFRVSLQVSEAEVQRAIDDVLGAYLSKVCVIDDSDTDQMECAMQLATILLIRRNTVATRAGGKVKNTPQLSETADIRQTDLDNADRLIRKVQTVQGVPSKLVDDIAGVYFRHTIGM